MTITDAQVTELAEESGNADAFTIWVESTGIEYIDADTALSEFYDAFIGCYDRGVEEYAEDCVNDGLFGEIPDAIAYYIDTKAIARDMVLGGDIWSEYRDGTTFIFRNC